MTLLHVLDHKTRSVLGNKIKIFLGFCTLNLSRFKSPDYVYSIQLCIEKQMIRPDVHKKLVSEGTFIKIPRLSNILVLWESYVKKDIKTVKKDIV